MTKLTQSSTPLAQRHVKPLADKKREASPPDTVLLTNSLVALSSLHRTHSLKN